MGTRAPRTDEVHPMLPCTSPVCQWLFLTRGFILGNQQSGTIWNCIKFACACRKVLFMKHSTVCPDGYWNTSSLVVIKVTEIGNRTWEQSWCGNGWPLATLCIPTWAAGPGQCLHISLGAEQGGGGLIVGSWDSRCWPWEICRLRCNAPSSCKNNPGAGDQMTTNLVRVWWAFLC